MESRDRYDSLLQFYAQEYEIQWQLLKAQMLAESAADPNAVSHAGAVGLAQFMPATWEEWGDGCDPTNPEASIRSQAKYMRWLLKQFDGQQRYALAAYNWGIGNVRKMLTRTGGSLDLDALPSETQGYIQRIDDILGGFDYA